MKVRLVNKRIEAGGWPGRGSHRHYKHPDKEGIVTVSGKPSAEVHPKTLASIWRQAQLEEEKD